MPRLLDQSIDFVFDSFRNLYIGLKGAYYIYS